MASFSKLEKVPKEESIPGLKYRYLFMNFQGCKKIGKLGKKSGNN